MSGDRANGMGASPTPWSAIDRYAQRYGIVNDEFELFVSGIKSLDSAMIGYQDKERERSERQQQAKQKATARKRK